MKLIHVYITVYSWVVFKVLEFCGCLIFSFIDSVLYATSTYHMRVLMSENFEFFVRKSFQETMALSLYDV